MWFGCYLAQTSCKAYIIFANQFISENFIASYVVNLNLNYFDKRKMGRGLSAGHAFKIEYTEKEILDKKEAKTLKKEY